MSTVTASIVIPAPPADVWALTMDPRRLGDWVTIHRHLIRADVGPPRVGYEMDQRIQMRGVTLDVHWRLVECKPGELAVWDGHGPARSGARTTYSLTPASHGSTRFEYRNEFRTPFGALGALVSGALVGGLPEREARRTLFRLRELFDPPPN
jgi:uncharacterized protein YndB with AHSA1/START domain